MSRTVLVTGASGGIGSAIARRFAEEGDAVVVGYNSNEYRALQLCEELYAAGYQAHARRADIRREADVIALFENIAALLGPVEVLVNNAGIAAQKLFQDITLTEWDEMMDTHVKGAFLCSRAALPAMLQRKSGAIVNISSMWGEVGSACEVHYSTAKAALIGMTKALAKETGPSGVRVNCVAPGVVDTPMLDAFTKEDRQSMCEDTPLCRLAKPEEIADAAVFLASEHASFITGQVLGINGGMIC